MILELILIPIVCASFSLFLSKAMDEGHILSKYFQQIEKLPDWVFYPLGGCIICFSSWIAIITLLFTVEINLLSVISFLGINYIFIFLWLKFIDNDDE